MIGAVGQTCSVRGPRAMYSFLLLLACVIFIDGISLHKNNISLQRYFIFCHKLRIKETFLYYT